MLSSVVSLPASSKGFVGLFCVGAQVLLSTVLAGVSTTKNNGLAATRTTKTVLSPTRCVPSNGTLSYPYVAAMGCATVIFATLFFMLRAKGFSYSSPCSPGPQPPPPTPPSPEYPVPCVSTVSPASVPPTPNCSGTGGEPPAPPPDPGSDNAVSPPRRRPWWLLLLLIVLAVGSYVYFTHNPDLSSVVIVAQSLGGQIVSTMEQCVLDGWTAAASAITLARIYISQQHGWYIAKILVLGLGSHCVCFVVFAVLRRLRRLLRRLLPSAIDATSIFVALISTLMMTACSDVQSVMWVEYHTAMYPSVREIASEASRLSSYLLSLVEPHLNEILVIGGIVLAHAIAMALRGSIRIASGLPLVAKDVLRELSYPPFFRWVVTLCFGHHIMICLIFSLRSASRLYIWLDPTVKQHLRQWVHCRESRESIRATFLWLAQSHQEWKSVQIADSHELLPGFKQALVATFKTLWELWCNLPIPQKLLITVPAIIFYGYLYIIPVVVIRRLPVRIPTAVIPQLFLVLLSSSYTPSSPTVELYIPPLLKSSDDIYPQQPHRRVILYPCWSCLIRHIPASSPTAEFYPSCAFSLPYPNARIFGCLIYDSMLNLSIHDSISHFIYRFLCSC
ncbi:hypothetical protein B0H16DRAFT_1724614 [Mycena metata]|uniref:Uncharacterized protein n=1 Tax=Mycena metata TaxID=1033252 RepID=A0AAD7N9D6_9AGAR|nr:hypothetical protein B0H16DRAFT_1724614 [Mycena metata]